MTILVLLAVFVTLAVAVAAATVAMQAAFYEQPVGGLIWRAPAVAAVATAWLLIMAWLDTRWPGRFDSMFRFPVLEVRELDQFWSERKTDGGMTETHFRRAIVPPGHVEYTDDAGKPWQRSDSGVVTAIILEENGQRVRFAARLDEHGNFLRDPRDPNKTLDVEYVADDGRVLTEATMGTLTRFRAGALCVNVLFNLAYLFIWVIALGFLMQFQWPHAFWLGLAGWAITLLALWPWLQSWVSLK